jgi:hypothetical protein
MAEMKLHLPASCGGEKCTVCGEQAYHKLEETIFDDDPQPHRHPLTAYVCHHHFNMIVRPYLAKR